MYDNQHILLYRNCIAHNKKLEPSRIGSLRSFSRLLDSITIFAKSVSDWEEKTKGTKRNRDKTNGPLEMQR